MILFITVFAAFGIAMILMTIGCAFRNPDAQITCARAEHCCRRSGETHEPGIRGT